MAEMTGEPVEIEGRTFYVRRAKVWDAKQVDRIASREKPAEVTKDVWVLDIFIEQIRYLLSANHPEITAEELEKLIDAPDLSDVHAAVLKAASMKKKEAAQGEAVSP